MGTKGSKSSGDPNRRPWPRYRSQHRQRSHEQAHADPQAHEECPALHHPEVHSGQPALITTQGQLTDLIGHLHQARRFGYDSEFIGEESYYPQICLIQVATPQTVALVDPLNDLDLQEFWAAIADENLETIVHAGEPDLEPVVRHLNSPPQCIFDTQIAAAFAGLAYPISLGKLLQEMTGHAMPAASRNLKFSQWDHRPLSPSQIRYAADDVRYLPLLREQLVQRLTALGNLQWARQECEHLTSRELYVFDPQVQRIRVRGVEKLSRRKQHVLRCLLQWRDDAARQQNVPPRSLLRDDVLFNLAYAPPKSLDDLKRVSGLPRPVQKHYAKQIIAATAAALQGDIKGAAAPPRRRAMDPAQREAHRSMVETVWMHIKERCEQRSINPAIATSKRELDSFLHARDTGTTPAEHRLCQGWRAELFGDVLAQI